MTKIGAAMLGRVHNVTAFMRCSLWASSITGLSVQAHGGILRNGVPENPDNLFGFTYEISVTISSSLSPRNSL